MYFKNFLLNIYEIIYENERIYIVLDNNDNNAELLLNIDKLILSDNISDKLNTKEEGIINGHGNPITKQEIKNLFKMEKSMCKISFKKIENNELKEGKGSGFFCEISDFPIKYALFISNHILNESSIDIGNTNFEYSSEKPLYKEIKITEKRKVITNEELDYTCIELFEMDDIKDYFKIEPFLLKYSVEVFKNNDIFILQFPKGNDISFSDGKILDFKDNKIFHNASTENGSSGSPIIRRCKDNYIIGLHKGVNKNNKYNLGTPFNLILDDIKEKINDIKEMNEINKINKINEINCIYILNKSEINLVHDFNENISTWNKKVQKLYLEAKNINIK